MMMNAKSTPPVPPAPPEFGLPPAERIVVAPDEVILSPYLMRDHIDRLEIDRLLQSIRVTGFAQAAKGMRRADGQIVLTAGKRQWLAARELGIALPIDVRPEGPLVAVVEALLSHAHHARLLPHEEGRLYRAALRDISRVLQTRVTQRMLEAWIGIDETTISMCLTILNHITQAEADRAGVDFAAAKKQSRKALYRVAKVTDPKKRAAKLAKLVTGQYPSWYSQEEVIAAGRAYSSRHYVSRRSTYSVHDREAITDADLDDLLATIRADVLAARARTRADLAA